MKRKLHNIFKNHFEWAAFSIGLILMISMNPYVAQGPSFCLFEWAGISFCPGKGLGHSIAFFFRGDISNALQANILGPVAAFILISRIAYLMHINIIKNKLTQDTYG